VAFITICFYNRFSFSGNGFFVLPFPRNDDQGLQQDHPGGFKK